MSLSAWRVVFAADAVNDLLLIENHLTQAYQDFGEPLQVAVRHAVARVEAIIANADRLALAPYRGEDHGDLLAGLRHLSLDQAIYWFQLCPELQEVRVLAVFFGGQDHQRHMLVRLLQHLNDQL